MLGNEFVQNRMSSDYINMVKFEHFSQKKRNRNCNWFMKNEKNNNICDS